MGVLTGLHRVQAETIKRLEANPELMDWLLGYSHDTATGEKLGFAAGLAPPQLGLDKAWDEILILLAGTDHHEAYQALHISLWEEYDGCEEIRLFSPAVVKNGLRALEKLKLDELRSEARRRDLRTYDGDPIDYLLDYTLGHFERLRQFWREAARAGEGIISETG
jgi:hypothetical protein